MSPAIVNPPKLTCCVCARPDCPLVEVATRGADGFMCKYQAHICRSCFEVIEPYGSYPHPETCKCRGTGCRYVGEAIVDDPCEEEQDDQEPFYDIDALRAEALGSMILDLGFGNTPLETIRFRELYPLVMREKARQYFSAKAGAQS
jgi:hypothetical protein